ncbi:MAG: hypothetical protein Tsb006_2020 [Rickettsiaceae bacterium]
MKEENKKFQRAIVFSGVLHLILLLIFLFGLPSVFDRLPEEQNVITFEVVDISEISNVKTESVSPKKTEEVKKSKEVKKSTKLEKPKPKKVEEPTKEKTPEKEKVEKAEDKKEAEKVTKEEPEKPKEEKKTPEPVVKKEPKKEQPKPAKAPKKAKEEDSIDSILKNLEQESVGDDPKAKAQNTNNQPEGKTFSRGAEYNEDSPLSITEKMLIKNQIQKYWSPPVAAQSIGDVRVLLHMTMEKNGTVKKVSVMKIVCPPGADATCKLTAETAIRAVWKASPIENLPPDRYDLWKEFNLFFDPSSMAL